MTSKNKCSVCGRTFKSKHAVYGHMKAHRGELKADKAPVSGEGEASTERVDTAPETVKVTGQFYPSLETWKTETTPGGTGETPAAEGEQTPAPSTGPTPAVFDTSGMWKAIGDFVDGSVLKNKPTKINMTDAKAKMLNDSLMSLGFMVEAPKEPVVVSYWMPFTLTMFSIFLMPIILSVAPDIFKKLPFGKKKKEPEPLAVIPIPQKGRDTEDEPIEGGPLGENLYDKRDRLP